MWPYLAAKGKAGSVHLWMRRTRQVVCSCAPEHPRGGLRSAGNWHGRRAECCPTCRGGRRRARVGGRGAHGCDDAVNLQYLTTVRCHPLHQARPARGAQQQDGDPARLPGAAPAGPQAGAGLWPRLSLYHCERRRELRPPPRRAPTPLPADVYECLDHGLQTTAESGAPPGLCLRLPSFLEQQAEAERSSERAPGRTSAVRGAFSARQLFRTLAW